MNSAIVNRSEWEFGGGWSKRNLQQDKETRKKHQQREENLRRLKVVPVFECCQVSKAAWLLLQPQICWLSWELGTSKVSRHTAHAQHVGPSMSLESPIKTHNIYRSINNNQKQNWQTKPTKQPQSQSQDKAQDLIAPNNHYHQPACFPATITMSNGGGGTGSSSLANPVSEIHRVDCELSASQSKPSVCLLCTNQR